MTDLSIFRIYEPHELKNGRYPFAWDRLPCFHCHGQAYGGGPPRGACERCEGSGVEPVGIKDLVREEAGHRCIRCGHPFEVGETGEYEREAQNNIYLAPPRDVSFDGLPAAQTAAISGRGIHWSPCDELCTHGGPFRCRPYDYWSKHRVLDYDWSLVEQPEVRDPYDSAGEHARLGHETQAAWRILTVHHLNERKFDCRWHNLVSLCQRCHLTIQRKVEMNQIFPFEHSEWFKPYAAAFYAYSYLGEELTREQTMERLDELLALERVA